MLRDLPNLPHQARVLWTRPGSDRAQEEKDPIMADDKPVALTTIEAAAAAYVGRIICELVDCGFEDAVDLINSLTVEVAALRSALASPLSVPGAEREDAIEECAKIVDQFGEFGGPPAVQMIRSMCATAIAGKIRELAVRA
jgi:hypothetical protein